MQQGAFVLEQCYEVMYGKDAIGKVQVIPQGLYCRIICRCRGTYEHVLRLFADAQGHRENLGVLIPEADGLLLDRKIPAKRLGSGKLRFYLSSGCGCDGGLFVPICPEEPFLYISRLKTAFLESEQGKIGIRIKEHPEAG